MQRPVLLLFLVLPLYAGESWIFLKDGRIGLGDPTTETLKIVLSDGKTVEAPKDQMQGQRTRAQVDTAVDGMMQNMLRGKNINEHAERFRTLRAAATPTLLEYLKHRDARLRLSALFGLQFCFTPNAKEPVLAAMKDSDGDVRKTAFRVLAVNLPEPELAAKLQPFADSEDLTTASLVFETVDKHHPDLTLKRIKRLLADTKYHNTILTRLSHYLSPSLSALTLPLVDSPNKDIQRTAIVGLISQLAGDEQTREKARGLLASPDADLRDLAAEYFTWLGEKNDLEALRRALVKETDVYAKASLEAAKIIIERRATAWSKNSSAESEFATLRAERPIEPVLIYGVVDLPTKDAVRERLFKLQALLAAPCGDLRQSMAHLGDVSLETAGTPLAPVREFFDPQRKSFGLEIKSQWNGPFSGSVHIGDDVSWRKELRSVVAISPGVVRSVEHAYSWGFIVIVEHTFAPDRKVCSLYAHLSPLLHVKPGDTLKAGQKIGSIGRHQCVENGGYISHLHFGLHEGPFSGGYGWVSGYIGVEKWQNGKHGWLDPQVFLAAKNIAKP